MVVMLIKGVVFVVSFVVQEEVPMLAQLGMWAPSFVVRLRRCPVIFAFLLQ